VLLCETNDHLPNPTSCRAGGPLEVVRQRGRARRCAIASGGTQARLARETGLGRPKRRTALRPAGVADRARAVGGFQSRSPGQARLARIRPGGCPSAGGGQPARGGLPVLRGRRRGADTDGLDPRRGRRGSGAGPGSR
jgi:hypothetical protein